MTTEEALLLMPPVTALLLGISLLIDNSRINRLRERVAKLEEKLSVAKQQGGQ